MKINSETENQKWAMDNSAAELIHLYRRINKYIAAHQKNTNDIISSSSYKLGYALTYPIRKIIGIAKGKPTPLFHSLKSGNSYLEDYEMSLFRIVRQLKGFGNGRINHSSRIEGYVDTIDKGILSGWYFDTTNTKNRLVIQVFYNDELIESAVCETYRPDLALNKIGDGHYGFSLNFNTYLKKYEGEILLKIKNGPKLRLYEIVNGKILAGKKFELTHFHDGNNNEYKDYEFCYDGIENNHLCGWIRSLKQPQKKITVLLYKEDEFIATSVANVYRSDLEFAKIGDGHYGYKIKIPYKHQIERKATFKAITKNGLYLGETEWIPNFHKKQLFIDPYKSNPDISLPVDDGFSDFEQDIVNYKIAVHIHVFYLDIFEDICNQLKIIPIVFDLFISTSLNKTSEIKAVISKHKLNCTTTVAQVVNRGRDIAPMIVDFGAELLSYDLALHLHTKKTIHNKELGTLWMNHILKCVLSDEVYLGNIFKLFKHDPQLGIAAPTLIDDLKRFYNWGENFDHAKKLMIDIGADPDLISDSENENTEFPAGTMFWFRPVALKKLLNSNLSYRSFPKEPIEPDGTIAHAIERCMYYIAEDSTFTYKTIKPLTPTSKFSGSGIKISIIMPVYNAQKWLVPAVQSVITQKAFLNEFELILIDNNSTDDSYKLCELFESIYPQVRYYKETKKGAGNARNLGLQKATGKYIFFLDADDLITQNCLQALLDKTNASEADLVVSPLVIFNEKGFNEASPFDYTKNQTTLKMHDYKKGAVSEKETGLLYALFSDFGPCAKLYKRSFIEMHNIRFPENTNYEDNIFIYNVYLNAKAIEVCGLPTYYYRKFDEDMGTTQSTSEDEKSLIEQCHIIKELQGLIAGKNAKHLANYANAGFTLKLYWLFNVLKQLPDTNSQFYIHLNQILKKIPVTVLEKYSKHHFPVFKAILKEEFKKAKSIFGKK